MTVRVLLLSGTRPLRARRVAERISSEQADFQVCGVVQQSLRQLPWLQQRIAAGDIDRIGSDGSVFSKAGLWIRKLLGEMVHGFLWFAHGCPRGVHATLSFTAEDLATCCRQSDLPFLLAGDLRDENVIEFVRRQHPHLIIALGEPPLRPDLLDVPSCGLARAVIHHGPSDATVLPQVPARLKLEHFAKGSGRAFSLVSLTVPSHPQTEPLGDTLKNDLIADDLLVQAAKRLGKASPTQASKEIKEWVQTTLAPYFEQFRLAPQQAAASPGRFRSILKLCMHSLLCLPWIVSRNWYRRIRARYPVLILAHHLVADRPHGMGIPTADFLRRIRFLQRQYRIVSLSEADKLLRSGRVKVPALVLTFDDGYCDNYVTLRSVAEEAGAKIALFLATRQVELHQEFAHDLAAGTKGFFPLTWDQVKDWSRRDVEFGSHTRTHFDCGSSDRLRLETEIVGATQDLEMRLDRPCSFFAFPFGKRENISPEAMQMAASTYSIVLSSYGGENIPHEGLKQQHLLRKGFYSDPWELELELQCVFDIVQSSKMRLKRTIAKLRPWPMTTKLMRRSLWTFLHACLLLLAVLPPFRRMLDEVFGDP